MATAKKAWVAFRTNAIIPASVLKTEEDKKVNAHEPVQVPEDYAEHVVHERFAVKSKAPKKKAAPKPTAAASKKANAPNSSEDPLTAAQALVEKLSVDLEALAADAAGRDDLTEQLKTAQDRVTELVTAS